MRILLLVFFLLVCFKHHCFSQATTFILVRHAEKVSDVSKDPALSQDGKQRAERLSKMLTNTAINAIYSTNYNRTKDTVAPIAQNKSLRVALYESVNNAFIDELLKVHAGQTLLVCGHSNTIPTVINLLLGKNEFKDFEDTDYDNLIVVTVTKKGEDAKVTWLKF